MLDFATFCKTHPPVSVSLDGYVIGPPAYDRYGLRMNLDHHATVSRLEPLATAHQVLMHLSARTFQRFYDDGRMFTAFVRDCDEDVCMATYLLTYPQVIDPAYGQRILRYVGAVAQMDVMCGVYNFINSTVLEELKYVFAPYREYRESGRIEHRQEWEHYRVIASVHERITHQLFAPEPQRIDLDPRYDLLYESKHFCVVREIGSDARTQLAKDGRTAFISVSDRPQGGIRFTAVSIDPMSAFSIPMFMQWYNSAEKNGGQAGGGNMVIGSDYYKGCSLSVEELIAGALLTSQQL